MSKRLFVGLCCGFLLLPVLVVGAFDGTDFSGTWALNRDKSEMGGMGRRGGRRGGGGRGGGMGGAMDLVIAQDGNTVNVTQGGMDYSFQIGGDAVTVEGRRGNMTIQAKWDGTQLIVNRTSERETPRGSMKIEETQVWSLSEDGQTLTQEVEANTPRGTQTRKLVFDKQ